MNNKVRILFLIFILKIKNSAEEDFLTFLKKKENLALLPKMIEEFTEKKINDISQYIEKYIDIFNTAKSEGSCYTKKRLRNLKANFLSNPNLSLERSTNNQKKAKLYWLQKEHICYSNVADLIKNFNDNLTEFDEKIEDPYNYNSNIINKICKSNNAFIVFINKLRDDDNNFVNKYRTESKKLTNRLIALLNNLDKAIEEAPE